MTLVAENAEFERLSSKNLRELEGRVRSSFQPRLEIEPVRLDPQNPFAEAREDW